MPILDYDDEFSYTAGPPATSKQSIVGTAGTAIVGGKVKDAGGGAAAAATPKKDWGAGEPIKGYIRTVDALVGATGGVQVDIVGADNAALTTNPVVLSTRTVTAAEFTANKVYPMPYLIPGQSKRYLGAKFTPLTTASTAGSLVCGLASEDELPQDNVNML